MIISDFDPEDFPIVVAIDFGTTFSGCAYAYAPEDTEARLLSDWPKQNIQYAKTPTLNLYKKVDGKYKMVEWGWKSKLAMDSPSKPDYIQLHQYKPYLDEDLAMKPWTSPVSTSTAISDYLYSLHEYAADKILQQFGPSYSRQSFRYCLTVPAMWSDKAKDVMRQAAIRANIIKESDHPDRLMLVSEPEAAALYCKRACKQYDLGHGDRFLICDAGGGTVDLIVYDITLSSEGQKLSEVTKGHGASCGSMFIDLNFGNLMIKKFGMEGAKFPSEIIPTLMDTFAYQLKPHFDGIEDMYLALPRSSCFDDIVDPEAIGIDGGYMCLKASELKNIVFEPVVSKVLTLIQGQLDKAKDCSAIFMVGGFGSSTYLLNRVKQEFHGMVKTISAPYKPEAAVVCGAVYVGLSPKTVTARVTRRCYGVRALAKFVEGVDPVGLKRYRVEGVCCANRFSTMIRKGQLVQINECISQTYCYVKQTVHESGECSIYVYAIDGEPPRYTTGISESAYITVPDPFKSSDPRGHEVEIEIKLFFGLGEIKVVGIVQGKQYHTRLRFDGGDSKECVRVREKIRQ